MTSIVEEAVVAHVMSLAPKRREAWDREDAAAAAGAAAGREREQREAVLSTLQSGRAMRRHEVILTSPALLGLMRTSVSAGGRVVRRTLTADGPAQAGRVSAEDLQCLLGLGYLVERGNGKWLEITDAGNALVRDLVVFARGWGAPAQAESGVGA